MSALLLGRSSAVAYDDRSAGGDTGMLPAHETPPEQAADLTFLSPVKAGIRDLITLADVVARIRDAIPEAKMPSTRPSASRSVTCPAVPQQR